MKKGYVQVYTGEGKGKTTAALGLGLRAVGRGFKVIMFQFLKGAFSGELKSTSCFAGRFQIIRLAETKKFVGAMSEKELAELKSKLQEEISQVKQVMAEKSCDILILDEIMAVIHAGLLSVGEVLQLIRARQPEMELVLTGRAVPPEISEQADLITEMKAVKHYMEKGVAARIGIEK